ncbi:hypothetical protein Pfo_025083, partial [Paulownia fortunei]
GQKMEIKIACEFDGRRAGGMKKLGTPDHAMNKKRRLILSHKWNMSKKSSLGAWILDVYPAFHLFCLWQAFLMKIPTFSSILRVLSSHYDWTKSFGNLAAEGLEDGEKGARSYKMHRFSCHPNGTQTRNIHYVVAAILRRTHLPCQPSPLQK